MSCSWIDLEKPIVFRTKRVILVRQCPWRDGPLPQEILGQGQAEKKVLEV
jgi:hypothetical protein